MLVIIGKLSLSYFSVVLHDFVLAKLAATSSIRVKCSCIPNHIHLLLNENHFQWIEPTVRTFYSCTNRPDPCLCLVVQTPLYDMSKYIPSRSMTDDTCESKLRSIVRLSMHPCPGNWVTIGCAVMSFLGCPRTQCWN